MHHENPKYPKTTTIPTASFKMTKIPLNPQNKKSTLETIENDLNIPKQSQITLSFLDFAGILVGLKFFCSFWSILWHFSNFCNVEVYILIILDVWGTLTVYEILTFCCSLQPLLGVFWSVSSHFSHSRRLQGILFILAMLICIF